MVRSVEAADYFFWDRFLRRLEGQTEFPQPESWYVPAVLVEGESLGPLPTATARQRRISDRAFAEAADWAFARNTSALIVMRDGRIEHQRWAPGFHGGRMLPVRSFTKTLPALVIGSLVADGTIKSIDAPLSTWLPEWNGDRRGAITLRQVLTMSSGLDTIRLTYTPDNLQIRLAEGSNVTATTLAWPMSGTPDTRWTVNQVDSQVLALVVERATGKPLQTALSERIWRPIGAGTATLNADGKDGTARAFCCMRASLIDFLRVGEMLRTGGLGPSGARVLPADFVAEMGKPTVANPYMGLHLFVGWRPDAPEAKGPGGSPLQVRHAAPYVADDVTYLLGGGAMSVWVIPSRGLTVLRWGTDHPDWDQSFLPNALTRAVDNPRRGGS